MCAFSALLSVPGHSSRVPNNVHTEPPLPLLQEAGSHPTAWLKESAMKSTEPITPSEPQPTLTDLRCQGQKGCPKYCSNIIQLSHWGLKEEWVHDRGRDPTT